VAKSLERVPIILAGPLLALLGCRDEASRIPALPTFARQNRVSISKFVEADRRVREEPRSAEAIGRLGMLYHAYAFIDEAQTSYRIARELAPDDFRFVYYAAKLEKTAFAYEGAEALFRSALAMKPDDAELWAELGDLYLMWNRREDAETHLAKAHELDPLQPVAALGMARLRMLEQKWDAVIEIVTPLLTPYPRLSRAHQLLAAAYGALGIEDQRAFHQEAGEYGSAVDSILMQELNEFAVDAILDGDPASGRDLLQVKCARCHNHERIYDHDEERIWWGRTVRRMQREAGWDWLTDDEAASVVAYLSERRPSESGR
jgi:tetratricopeptide (TPR) repeat protein